MAVEKIERVLGALSEKELEGLGRYLESAYFPIPKGVREFGLAYLKVRRAASSQQPGWEALSGEDRWRLIFGEVVFQDGKWRKLKSQFLEWVLKFMVLEQEQVERTALSGANLLLRAFYHRGLGQEFEALAGEVRQNHSAEKIVNERDMMEQFRYWELAYNYALLHEDPHKATGEAEGLLAQRIAAFERYVYFDYLRTANGIENRRKMRATSTVLHFPAGFAAFLKSERQGGIPLLESYVRLFDLLVEEDSQAIPPFLEHFAQAMSVLDQQESSLLFDYAVNVLIRRYLQTPTLAVAHEVFSLYRSALGAQFWDSPTVPFPLQHFKNVCTVGCRVGEVEFVHGFVEAQANRLPVGEETRNILGYCRALVLFGQGAFVQSLQVLHGLDLERYLKVEIRMLEIRGLCALSDWDLVESRLSSFERFLQRSNLAAARQKAMLGRIRMIRKILSVDGGDAKVRAQLEAEIRAEHVMDGEWLLELEEASRIYKIS